MKTNEQIQKLVIQWAAERGINDPVRQRLKFNEEYGELCCHYLKGMDITDDIGDTAITLILLQHMEDSTPIDFFAKFYVRKLIGGELLSDYSAKNNLEKVLDSVGGWFYMNNYQESVHSLGGFAWNAGYCINKCLNHAWNQIKDRKGKTVDGTFIREDVQ